jgi:hypothetical protein
MDAYLGGDQYIILVRNCKRFFFWFANENDLRISLFGCQIDCSSEYSHALTVSVDNVASMKIINSPRCLCELIMMMSFEAMIGLLVAHLPM